MYQLHIYIHIYTHTHTHIICHVKDLLAKTDHGCMCVCMYIYIYVCVCVCVCVLEKEMATHSSILSWRIPWTEEPGGLQSMESQGLDIT